jgi:hypothetical protein
VLDLYATFDSDELESARRFYPRWTGRRDKVSLNLCPCLLTIQRSHTQHGIPVYIFRLASLTGPLQKDLNAVPEGRRYQRMCVSDLPDHQCLIPTPLRPTTLASPSGSSCAALPFPSVPPSPTRPLRPRVHLPSLFRLSLQRLRLLTSAVSPSV